MQFYWQWGWNTTGLKNTVLLVLKTDFAFFFFFSSELVVRLQCVGHSEKYLERTYEKKNKNMSYALKARKKSKI